MHRFFNKNIPVEKLEQLLQNGAGASSLGVQHSLRRMFDLIGKPGDLFYEKLKLKDSEALAFDNALLQLSAVLPSSSKTAIRSFEYIWDKEIILLLQSGDEILEQWTMKYFVHRFYKIKKEERFRKYRFEETVSQSIFNDALDQFIRRLKSGMFKQKSTLRTFFSTILYNEFVNETRRRDADKRSGDKRTFWDQDDGFVDDLIYSKGKIQDGLSKIDYDHLMKILDIFGKENHKCFELITTTYLDEISIPVLAERRETSRNNLTVQRYNCFKELRVFWGNNQNV